MMKMKKCLIVIVFYIAILTLYGCNYYGKISQLHGKEITFDFIDDTILSDTIVYEKISRPIKIVVYVDSSFCTPCLSKYFVGASQYISKFGSDSILYLIILNSNNNEELPTLLNANVLPNLLILNDISGDFINSNSLGELWDQFNAFLVDKDNKIILIGDPLRNIKIRELYEKKINQLLGDLF